MMTSYARPIGDGLVRWRNVEWKVGRVIWHPRLHRRVVVMEDGRMWEILTGQWIRPKPVPWNLQVIGHPNVVRCPKTWSVAWQPGRQFGPRRTPTARHHYILRRRQEGATLRQIGIELGISVERVRQLRDETILRWWPPWRPPRDGPLASTSRGTFIE